MIKSVWKPFYIKGKINFYEIIDKEFLLEKKGTTAYKVLWVCDDNKCKTPNKLHSISACHLIKEKMSYNKQICRNCQCTGEGNGRFGDKRKWSDFLPIDKINLFKEKFSKRWCGDLNPSKLDHIKIKKNQVIINEDYIKKVVNDKNMSLINIINLNGKFTKFIVKCENNHISNKTYVNFSRSDKKFNCSKCFYESISIKLTDEELLKVENYKKQVRSLSAKTYKTYKDIINPNNLKKGKKDYHIDHKYSLYEGYKNNVDVRIISSKENLQMLKYSENLSKQGKCDITLEELLLKTKYLFKNQ